MVNEGNGQNNSALGALFGVCIPLVLLGAVLAIFYFAYLALRTPGPYPFLAGSDGGEPIRSRQTGASSVSPSSSSEPGGEVTAAVATETTPEAKPVAATAGDQGAADNVVASAEAGEGLYNTFCMACHQAEGAGKVGFAPFIRNHDFLALASDKFLHDTIVTGRPGTAMVGWSHLKPHEIESLILYLRAQENPELTSLVTVDPNRKHPGDANLGANLYGQYCATCHGENAGGYAEGGPGPAIGNAGFLAAASDDFIFQTVKIGRRGTAMRAFSGSRGLANLSDPEIANIIAFLRTRGGEAPKVVRTEADPKAGEQHFQTNCAACHQQDGTGLPGFAPSIRNRDFLAIASDEFIKQTVHNGRPGTSMVQRPDLSDQILSDIVAYLRALPVETSVEVSVDPSKDLADLGSRDDGQAKYAVYCASCHGVDGTGYVSGGVGPAIGLSGFLDAASDDYIYQTLKLGRIGTAMKPFLGSTGLANLNDQDAHDIIAYLRGLNPSTN